MMDILTILLEAEILQELMGLSLNSFIVQNENGIAMKILNRKQGMISDQMVDLNKDDFLDLVLVGDWMPVTVLINNDGKSFENKTLEYGLSNLWALNTVEIFDFNQDILI